MRQPDFPPPCVITLASLSVASAYAVPVSYTLPEETAAFKPGTNLEVVQKQFATACTPLRRLRQDATARRKIQKADFWQAEVIKMINNSYGAADRRCGCRKDRRLSHRELLRNYLIHSSCLSPRPFTASGTKGYGRISASLSKPEPAAVLPRSKAPTKRPKRRKCGTIWGIFALPAMPFALPSLPYPAYPVLFGHAGVRGPAARFFFDPAETT